MMGTSDRRVDLVFEGGGVKAGYPGTEIERIVSKGMHFPSFEDPPRLHEFGALGDAMDIASMSSRSPSSR